MGFLNAVLAGLVVTTCCAWADNLCPKNGPTDDTTPGARYDCEVIVIADDLPNGSAEFQFQIQASTSFDHGTQATPFSVQDHEISVTNEPRFMGILWLKNNTTVARVITARGEDADKPQALVVYNPANPNEQVSLDCTPTAP